MWIKAYYLFHFVTVKRTYFDPFRVTILGKVLYQQCYANVEDNIDNLNHFYDILMVRESFVEQNYLIEHLESCKNRIEKPDAAQTTVHILESIFLFICDYIGIIYFLIVIGNAMTLTFQR